MRDTLATGVTLRGAQKMSEPHRGKAPSKKKRKARQKPQRGHGQGAEGPAKAKSHFEASTPASERSRCSFDMDKRRTCLGFDQESEPDRSDPPWKISPSASSGEEEMTSPEEEDLGEGPTLWEQIMEEYEKERLDLMNLNVESKAFEPEIPVGRKLTAVQYLDQHVFPLLCPALEETLFCAKKEDCLQIQKCIFNGLDHISEILWNRNPRHPGRQTENYKNIFDIPFVKIWLNYHPRPIYPLSWVWTLEEAVTILQAYIRRYLVCREHGCHEMRKFWQVFKEEKREEERQKQLRYLNELQETAVVVLEEIIVDAVCRAERKTGDNFCISKRYHCKCKCCRCYKQEKSNVGDLHHRSEATAASEVKMSRCKLDTGTDVNKVHLLYDSMTS